MDAEKVHVTEDFDRLVIQYNDFRESIAKYNRDYGEALKDPKFQKKYIRSGFWRSFKSGLTSIFGVVSPLPTPESPRQFFGEMPSDPLDSNEDLTLKQRDAIKIASDWLRHSRNLDIIVAGEEGVSIENVRKEKLLTQQRYEDFRDVYLENSRK